MLSWCGHVQPNTLSAVDTSEIRAEVAVDTYNGPEDSVYVVATLTTRCVLHHAPYVEVDLNLAIHMGYSTC